MLAQHSKVCEGNPTPAVMTPMADLVQNMVSMENYHICLTAFFQDSLGKPAPER